MGSLESRVRVLETTVQGPILEIAFVGRHVDGVGHEVTMRAQEALASRTPVAVVFNFLEFSYRFGNDIGGVLGSMVQQPSCLVADGATERSLRSLFNLSKLRYECFHTVDEALGYLRRRLDGAPA